MNTGVSLGKQDYVRFLRDRVGSDPLILVGTTVFIFREDGKFLMQKRRDNQKWSCPGGMMEPGESLEETARREVFEETGLNSQNLTLITVASGSKMYYQYPNGDKVYNVTAVFSAQIDTRQNTLLKDNESTELAWFSSDALPSELSSPTRVMLEFFIQVNPGHISAR
jgi:8-oxo-dGTP pyrophosphatase MutT (NUDIX family)